MTAPGTVAMTATTHPELQLQHRIGTLLAERMERNSVTPIRRIAPASFGDARENADERESEHDGKNLGHYHLLCWVAMT